MTEVILSFIAKVAEYLVEPTVREGRYLFCGSKITRNLESEKQKLKSALESVQKLVEEAHCRVETIDDAVSKWLKEVENLIGEVEKLQQEKQESKACFHGWCPSPNKYRLCKQMAKRIETAIGLNTRRQFNPFSRCTPIPDVYFSSENFIYFESTKVASDKLLEALGDDGCYMIGLYGMGGSGKTTLAKEVGKEAKKSKLFDHVVFTTVSQTPNVRKIQGEIADLLNAKLDEETEAGRARRIALRLQSGERILVILDDVWTKVNLEDIGIPLDGNRKKCKVLLTTRRLQHADIDDVKQEVVAREVSKECKGLPIAIVAMGTCLKGKDLDEMNVVLHKLRHSKPLDVDGNEKDAFACLRLSYDYLKSDEAKLLFLLCAMFPEDHKIVFEDLLRYGIGLRTCEGVDSFEMARSQVNVAINNLVDSCLLMHENDKFGQKIFLKMHDMVRDVALWIASQENHAIMVNHRKGLSSLSKDGTLKDCYAASCWNTELDQFFRQLDAPKLELLLLHVSYQHIDLAYASFEDLKGLKVLAIEGVEFGRLKTALPRSIDSLSNLHTLRLVFRELGDISFVVNLTSLEVLDIRGSKFNGLPNGLENLKKLKLLDLSNCLIDGGCYEVIQRCLQLQELYMWGNQLTDSDAFCLDDVTFPNLQRYQLQVGELAGLSDVVTFSKRVMCFKGLNISFLNTTAKDLLQRATQVVLEGLDRECESIVPDLVQAVGGMHELTELYLESCLEMECVFNTISIELNNSLPNLVKLNLFQMDKLKELCLGPTLHCIFQNLETVKVDRCFQLLSMFPRDCNLCNLKYLKIDSCSKLTNLFPMSVVPTLLSLQELHIEYCDELKHIITNGGGNQMLAAPDNTFLLGFSQLRKLYIHDCYRLEYMFPISVVQSLKQLEEIWISGASSLKYVFSDLDSQYHSSYQNDVQIVLPHLKTIILGYLWNLVKIFPERYYLSSSGSINNSVGSKQVQEHANKEQVLSFPRLQSINLRECRKLKCVFPALIHRSLPELTGLFMHNCEELEEIFEETQEHENPCNGQVCFPKLAKLHIKKCKKLKTVFSVDVARVLPNLSSLRISRADELVEIFRHTGEDNCDNDKEIMLPKLSELRLKRLPSLVDICGGFNLHAVELCKVLIFECPKLASISRSSRIKSFHHITEEQILSFPHLQSIELIECGQLRFVFSSVVHTILPELTKLLIYNCDELEEIFEEKEEMQNQCNGQLCFPKLAQLDVKKCNKLKTIFSINMARVLPQLSSLCISEADRLVEIFRHKSENKCDNNDSEIMFPKLSKLTLEKLPNLLDICQGFNIEEEAVELCEIVIHGCPNLAFISRPSQMISSYQNMEGLEAYGRNGRNLCLYHEIVNPIASRLTKLSLGDLPELRFIWMGSTHFLSLQCLEELKVYNCGKLKSLLSAVVQRSLPHLRNLVISGCEELEEIVVENEESYSLSGDQVCFPKLQYLSVEGCPKLKSLFSAIMVRIIPQIRSIEISKCAQLEEIFGCENMEESSTNHRKEIVLPNLTHIRLQHLPSLVDICRGFSLYCVKLDMVMINECPKFTPFLGANQVISSVHQSKEVSHEIQALQAILNVEMQFPVEEELQGLIMVSNLEILTLENLPELVFIWNGPTLISFQHLKHLYVNGCRKLRCIFSDTVIRSLPLLEYLDIKQCEELEEIISYRLQQFCLPKLRHLTVVGCNRLRCVWPLSVSPCPPRLWKLEIRRCSQLEQVFGCAPEDHHDARVMEFQLPNLTCMTLQELPRLDNLCRGFESQLKLKDLKRCEVKDCPNLSSLATIPDLHKFMSPTQIQIEVQKSTSTSIEPKFYQ
ncbi:disease resistance protein [Senna tora]|uniref:Disease resistance protein n=1 Tax=Senna tora TaxID=362788 RepID=A0A834WWF3_9FABA|nr:disease resistance protein [Senna tora]